MYSNDNLHTHCLASSSCFADLSFSLRSALKSSNSLRFFGLSSLVPMALTPVRYSTRSRDTELIS